MEVEKEETIMEHPSEMNGQTSMLSSDTKPKSGMKLSASDQILAGTNQNLSYLYPNVTEALMNPCLFQNTDMATLSRSMTALGLSNTIPEEPSDLDPENSVQLQNASRIASKSAIDLVGLNEDQVFDVTAEGDKAFSSNCGGISSLINTNGASLNDLATTVMNSEIGNASGLASGFSFQTTIIPSRCLLISKLSPMLLDNHLTMLLQNFGEIQSIRTEYRMQGIAQVTFFDVRSAISAKDQLHGYNMGEQCLDVQFALTPGSVGAFGDATILVFNIDPKLDAQQFAASFLAYGDVKQVQTIPEKEDYRLVEFFDIRHASAALSAMNSGDGGGPSSKNILSSFQTPGIKHTMSLHNLIVTDVDKEDDQSSRSWDSSAHAIQQMETLMGLETNSSNKSNMSPKLMTNTASSPSFLQSLNSGMTKSVSFGSGLCDMYQQQGLDVTTNTHNKKTPSQVQSSTSTPLRARGAVQLTQQLAEGLKLSDSASSLGHITGLGNSSSAQFTANPTVAAMAAANSAKSPLLAGQGLLNRSGLSYSSSVGTGLDTYGQQNLPNMSFDGASGQQASMRQPNTAGSGASNSGGGGSGNLGLGFNTGYNQYTSNYLPNNTNSGLLGQGNVNGNLLQAIAMAQAAGVNVYEALSKIPSANLAQLLTSGMTTGAASGIGGARLGNDPLLQANANSFALGNTPSSVNAAQLAVLQNLASSSNTFAGSSLSRNSLNTSSLGLGAAAAAVAGLDLGTMSKSASSPALHAAMEDRQQEIPRSGGRLSRRNVDPLIEAERRAQQQRLYALDLDKIRHREDKRTTLMIKNIPNKYTQKMLLASIDETLKGTYDFFYLPIDFKNKCNVGYGFINMREATDIIPLVERFHNKKWERFNSEKICCVAYGRIQGKQALINHFQNSSLMHEDKKHRPVLFVTDGPSKGDPEPFPVGTNVRPKISFKERDFRSRERSGHWG